MVYHVLRFAVYVLRFKGALLLSVCQRLVAPARLDLLAVPEAEAFYTAQGFRPFAGFRHSALADDEPS